MSRLFISKLEVQLYIGVHAHEQDTMQPVYLDIDFPVDVALAAKTDDLSHAVDYQKVCNDIVAMLAGQRFGLVETVAKRVSDYLTTTWGAKQSQVVVIKKTQLMPANWIGVRHCVGQEANRSEKVEWPNAPA